MSKYISKRDGVIITGLIPEEMRNSRGYTLSDVWNHAKQPKRQNSEESASKKADSKTTLTKQQIQQLADAVALEIRRHSPRIVTTSGTGPYVDNQYDLSEAQIQEVIRRQEEERRRQELLEALERRGGIQGSSPGSRPTTSRPSPPSGSTRPIVDEQVHSNPVEAKPIDMTPGKRKFNLDIED
jgi:hypothetical protein